MDNGGTQSLAEGQMEPPSELCKGMNVVERCRWTSVDFAI